MAEIDIAKLPIIPSNEFTGNDLFVVINDGKSQLLSRSTLEAWINTVSQGEQGDQGVAGRDGRDGRDGTNGISATHRWSGTTLSITSASGTSSADLKGSIGLPGTDGTDGTNGWSPIYAVVARQDDQVLMISGWTGGTGNQPAVGQYLGSSGLVNDINQAANIRGMQGLRGETGEQGEKGETGENGRDGVDGTGINSVEYLPNGAVKINKSDDTSVQTNPPPRLTGWQSYKDTQYTQASPYILSAQVETVIPNNSGVIIGELPTTIPLLYSPTTQKVNLQDIEGLYSVKVRFKVATPTEANDIRITFSKDTTENPFVQDVVIPVSPNPRNINVNTTIYGDSALVSNGMSIRLFSDKATSIYDVEFTIAKII